MLMLIKELHMTNIMENERYPGSLSQDSDDQIEVITVATQGTAAQTQQPCSPVSQASTRTLDNESICRICLDRGTEPLVSPCKCSGSAMFAHESCLLQWFFKTRRRRCELCLSEVNVKSVGFKPLQKWRLPMDSCDFVFYLFTLYCVIMFVFTGMIIWIATQGCLSPVCITLYVICSMSLVYFIYCCGCVEYSKTYWKACVTTNKNWRIYNREESGRSKIKGNIVISTGSESGNSKKSVHVITELSPEMISSRSDMSVGTAEISTNFSEQTMNNGECLSGSTTIIPSQYSVEDSHRIEVVSPHRNASLCGSPVRIPPVLFRKDFAHTGSISLLMGLNCSPQLSPCQSPRSKDGAEEFNAVIRKLDVTTQKSSTENIVEGVLSQDEQKTVPKEEHEGVSNRGYDDTKF